MRIGVLGGSFDPPHAGHLALAHAAKKALELDEVILLPASRNPLKSDKKSTPAKHRLAMVQKLIENEEGLAVCDLEVVKGGLSYTVETMTDLTAAQPAEYWFLLGADALRGLPQWKQPQRLVRLCRLGVVVRPPMSEYDAMLHVPEEFKASIDLIPMKAIEISSSEIREKLARRQAAGPHLPPTVLQYIKEHQLYQPN
jgi:nicotinate-nucleotide adenylyltransferase